MGTDGEGGDGEGVGEVGGWQAGSGEAQDTGILLSSGRHPTIESDNPEPSFPSACSASERGRSSGPHLFSEDSEPRAEVELPCLRGPVKCSPKQGRLEKGGDAATDCFQMRGEN